VNCAKAYLVVFHHGERPLHGLDPVLGDLSTVALLNLCDPHVGPTECYRHLLERVCSGGRGAMLYIPIRLLPYSESGS
jgi:hypothetical protein